MKIWKIIIPSVRWHYLHYHMPSGAIEFNAASHIAWTLCLTADSAPILHGFKCHLGLSAEFQLHAVIISSRTSRPLRSDSAENRRPKIPRHSSSGQQCSGFITVGPRPALEGLQFDTRYFWKVIDRGHRVNVCTNFVWHSLINGFIWVINNS